MTTTTASVRFAAPIVVALAAPFASAEIIELRASGTIDSVQGFGFPIEIDEPSVGDAWSLGILYDAAAAPASGGGNVANYTSVLSYELTLGGQVISATPGMASVQRFAANGPSFADGYFFFGEALLNDFDDGLALELKLFDFDPFLSSLDLPNTLSLDDVPDAQIEIEAIFDGSTDGFTRATGGLTSLSLRSVPTPASLAVLGAAGAFAARRRR